MVSKIQAVRLALRCSFEDVDPLMQMPTVTLLDADGEQHQTHLRRLRSYFTSDDITYYHLHPELVQCNDDVAAYEALFCEPCSKALKMPTDHPPLHSIAKGCDFALLTRLGLERPSAFEVLLLAEVRT